MVNTTTRPHSDFRVEHCTNHSLVGWEAIPKEILTERETNPDRTVDRRVHYHSTITPAYIMITKSIIKRFKELILN